MKHIKKTIPIIISITLLLIIGISNISANPHLSYQDDKLEIETIIYEYFATRYQSGKSNIDQNFSSLIDVNSKLINDEIEKIKLENYINQLNDLYYSSYEFNLENLEYNIDGTKNIASVLLSENSDVIYNISIEIDKDNPIVTKLRGLKHKITLTKTETGWIISSDDYEDLVWKFIHGSGLDPNEVKNIIDQNIVEENFSQLLSDPSCNLPYDTTTHEYNRNGAVNYAKFWALSRNPNYYNFERDCTNFISQAIHVGSSAGMSDESQSGWYYYNVYNRGAAWTDVEKFHLFTTHEYERDYFYQSGPEGCDLASKYDLRLGDIVQFDFTEEEEGFDHSVIITEMEYVYGEYFYYFSAHSNDYLNKPLDSVLTYLDRRFIRIERIDGLIPTFIPFVSNNSGYTASSSSQENIAPLNQAYPAPETELLTPIETTRIGYP